MKHPTTRWLCLLLWCCSSLGIWGLADAQAQVVAPEDVAPAVVDEGSVSRALGATLIPGEGQGRIIVEGLAFQEVTAWMLDGQNLTGDLHTALAEGAARVQETAAGFEVIWQDPPAIWQGTRTGQLTLDTRAGVQLPAAPLTCPSAVAFGAATSPVLAADATCRYGSNTCTGNTRRHTGIDYPGTGSAIAIAAGTVVRKETLNASDHGLGNNLILRHLLPGPNCSYVYSSYAHLATLDGAVVVGQAVTKGQTLGAIGRSGFGNPNYWPQTHLHLEMKSAAVTGNPLGAGNQTLTCATDPLNAKTNSCWLYVANTAAPATAPDDYGYLDPAAFLNKTLRVPAYRQISAGGTHNCTLKTDNSLACWGDNDSGQATPPAGTFRQVSAGDNHSCALRTDNTLACWGANDFGKATPPAGTFSQVSAGGFHSCALRSNNTLVCWGRNDTGQLTRPAGTFIQVSAGSEHNCALRTDHTLACWGWNDYGQATPPAGTFSQVSAGEKHSCALKNDNSLACWGDDSAGQATPPAGSFRQISAGSAHSCAIKTDNSLACWGDNYFGQTTPPDGTFRKISAGLDHNCALKTDHTLACWGDNDSGQATPPDGTFKQIDAGGSQSCALQTDNRLACWGGNYAGAATPPAGTFRQISTGAYSSCAIRTDNFLRCWGAQVR